MDREMCSSCFYAKPFSPIHPARHFTRAIALKGLTDEDLSQQCWGCPSPSHHMTPTNLPPALCTPKRVSSKEDREMTHTLYH